MAVLKKVVPSDRTKYYPDEYDYLSSFGDTLGQLVAPGGGQDYAKMALIGQRGALANKYLSETEGQALKNKLTGYKIDAVDLGRNDPKFKDSPFMQSIFANVKNSHDMAQAMEIYELLKGKKEQQAQTTLAGNMMLDIGGRPPGPSEIALNVADEMEADEIPLPEEVPWSTDDKLGAFAFLSGKAPEAGSTFTEEDQLNLRASQPTHTATDLARALMIEKTTPGKVNLLEKQANVQTEKAGAIKDESSLNQELLKRKITSEESRNWLLTSQAMLENEKRLGVENKTLQEKVLGAERLNLLKSKTSLNWAEVDKVTSQIANGEYESALKGLETLAKIATEEGELSKVKQEVELVKQNILNLKATAEQQKNESAIRVKKDQAKVDLTRTEETQVQVEIASDAEESDAKVDLLRQQGETELQKTLLGESKDQGQRIKNYNLLKSGASEPGKIKTSTTSKKTSSGTGDIYADELAKNSAKYAKPIVVTVNPGDPDPWGWGDAIPAEEYTLQPTDARRLVDAVKAGFGGNPPGEVSAFSYLSSIAKTPKAAVHLMHHMFNWTDDKRDKYLESLEE